MFVGRERTLFKGRVCKTFLLSLSSSSVIHIHILSKLKIICDLRACVAEDLRVCVSFDFPPRRVIVPFRVNLTFSIKIKVISLLQKLISQ